MLEIEEVQLRQFTIKLPVLLNKQKSIFMDRVNLVFLIVQQGKSFNELTDHIGNVRTTFTTKKLTDFAIGFENDSSNSLS